MTSLSLKKSWLRLATALHADLARPGHAVPLAALPTAVWDRAQQLVRHIRRAEGRGWLLASAALRSHLRYEVRALQTALAMLADELDRLPREPPPLTELYEDLSTLENEFAHVEYDPRARQLSVTTEPITLSDLALGPFEIRLDWGRRTSDSCYRVIACEPYPSQSRESVTHPHVLDQALCAGDGLPAIRRALVDGRLLDFFRLVAAVLRTYNPDSPFVAIEDWHGRNCADCGYLTDELSVCGRCEAELCNECTASCVDCGDSYCPNCLERCGCCDERLCPTCLRACCDCGVVRCPSCLVDQERCATCHDQLDHHPADAAVPPHRLGQAAVPA